MWFEEVLDVALLWKRGGGIVESGKHGRCRRCSSRFCVCECRNGTACMYVHECHVMHCVKSGVRSILVSCKVPVGI